MSLSHSLYFSLFPQAGTLTTRAHGLDISKYDLHFRPDTATAQLDFVIQRVSYRTTRDEAFETLLPGVLSVPIRGGYHYLNSDKPWREQADAYLRFIDGYPYHFHACDFEDSYNVLSLDFAYQAWQWIHYVEGRTGKPVFLYTSPSLYGQWIYPSQARYGINWNDVDLWTAQWFFTPNPDGTPSNPRGRTAGWRIWQYTADADGTKYGVARPTACDLDVWNGPVQQMMEFLKIGNEPPPQPQPEDPMRYTATALSDGTRLRSSHDTTLTPVGSYPRGTEFHGELIWEPSVDVWQSVNGIRTRTNMAGDKWLSVSEIGGLTRVGWVAIKHMGVEICGLRDNGAPPAEEITPPDYIIAGWAATATRPAVEKRYIPE